MLNNHSADKAASGPTDVGQSSSSSSALALSHLSASAAVSSSSSTLCATASSVSTSAAPVAGACAAEITAGAFQLSTELREFCKRQEQTQAFASCQAHMDSIGSASWPAVKEDATADLQLATCRKLREVSLIYSTESCVSCRWHAVCMYTGIHVCLVVSHTLLC
jgi:hypothetical protein